MCRLMAYMGHPALLADVVLWPDRSIIKQSYDARERIRDPTLPFHLGHGNLNGDGFGIGWFNQEEQRQRDPTPCVFTSITPAWNNENLARLACKIISPVVFAHVRAAYPGMPVSEQNCHPFQWGRYLWMHNGVMGGFSQIRRALLANLSDAAYNTIQSFHSDSAVSFAVFLHHLPDLTSHHPPAVLLKAMHDTLATIAAVQAEHEVTATSLLNFVVSDGTTLIATRYVFPETESPPSLYYAEGADFVRKLPESADGGAGGKGTDPADCKLCSNASQLRGSSVLQESSYTLTYGERGAAVALVASEPITGSATDWVAVPRNTAICITREKTGYLNTMWSPLAPREPGDQHLRDVGRCLDSISRGVHEQAALWSPRRAPSGPQQAQEFQDDAPEPTVVPHEHHRLTAHNGPVLALVLDPVTARLYTASVDTTVKVWDLDAATCTHTLRGHRKPVVAVQLQGSRLHTIGGRIVRIWDTRTLRCLYALNCSYESGYVRSLSVLPESHLYVGGQDTRVRAIPLDPAAFDPSNPTFTDAPGSDLAVAQPRKVSDPLSGHVGSVNALTVCGGYICSGGADTTVRVWSVEDLEPVGVLRGHRGAVMCLLAVGELLLSGARDNTIRVWDLETDMLCRKTLTGHQDDVTALATIRLPTTPAPSIRRALSSFAAFQPAPQTPHQPSPLNPHHAPDPQHAPQHPLASRLSASAEWVASDYSYSHADHSGTSSLANSVDSGSPRAHAPASAVDALPVAAATLVASASADGTIRIWTTRWVCVRILSATGPVDPPPRSKGGLHSALWNAGAAPKPQPVTAALSVAISAQHIACGYADGTVRLWRGEELQCAAALCGCDANPLPLGAALRAAAKDNGTGHEDGNGCTANGNGAEAGSGSSTDGEGAGEGEDLKLLSSSAPTPSGQLVRAHMLRRRSAKLAVECSAGSPSWLLKLRSSWMGRSPGVAGGQAGARETIEQEMERCLREFVRIRTVSADPKLRDECFQGAKYLAALLESVGADVKMYRASEERNPLVLGRIGSNPARPTITFYGHYDVQPAAEPDWKSPPFELAAVDGYLYGRGTSDNKGPVLAFVFAVKELLERYASEAETKALPFNIAFLLEGEEEVGSVGFRDALAANLDWFEGTRVVVMSNTLWVGEERPCLTYGMRGMLAMTLEVTGPERELHSGNDGGVFNEPMLDLVKVAGTLVDARSRIAVDGFYEHVQAGLLDLALPGLQDSREFSVDGYQATLGVPALTAPPNTRDLLEARWCKPSLSIVDVRPAYGQRCRSHGCAGPCHHRDAPPNGRGPLNGAVHHAAGVLSKGGSSTSEKIAALDAVAGGLAWMACGMNRNEESWVWGSGAEHTTGATSSLFSFGPTRFSVIPKAAVAKISVRYVPNQNAVDLISRFRAHVEGEFKKLGSANRISVHIDSAGDWWEADPRSPFFQKAQAALRREWGTDPLCVREGGTMPVASLIEKMLGAPALMIPMGQSSDNCHLANERIRRVNLLRGKNVIRHLLEELAELGDAQ